MHDSSRAWAVASTLLIAPLAAAGAVAAPPASRDAAETATVTLTLMVSKAGQPVTDLQPTEIEVRDGGRPRAIEVFEYVDTVTGDAPEAPGDFVLLLDDLGTSPAGTGAVISVGLALADALGPNDRLALLNTGPFPLTRAASTERVGTRATIRQFIGQRQSSSAGSSRTETCRRSVVSLSALEAALKTLAQLPGTRRALLVVGDAGRTYWGEARHERCGKARTVFDRVVALARVADVSIYAVGVEGRLAARRREVDAGRESSDGDAGPLQVNSARRPSAAPRGGLDLLAAATGGTFADEDDLIESVHSLVRDSRRYYRLAYRAPDVSRGARRGLRSVEVQVRRPGLDVRARHHDGPP